ncbi:MAG: methyltransferase domain-containing protein [Deltaproteobacteria bacterium]|nr:methyltransferase domain-containing protein [Deltaproteobacteria bacterium]
MTTAGDHPFTSDLFVRLDETDDALFYAIPRKVVHLDEGAGAAASRFYGETLPPNGTLLDLMASWRSHLPADLPRRRVIGLGMNAEEMSDNPDLDEWVVHDLNKQPALPFAEARFDGALLTVSVQYLVKPIEVFRSVARSLRPGAPFIVSISHRCFPPKAVKIWQECRNMRERMELAMAYFRFAGGFDAVQGVDLRPEVRAGEDPVLAIFGKREGDAAGVRRPAAGWRRR